MGIPTLLAVSLAMSGASALATNVRANRASSQISKTSIKAPSSAITDKKEEDKITLGSDRARTKGERSKGRRQLMASQSTADSKSPTGLQI